LAPHPNELLQHRRVPGLVPCQRAAGTKVVVTGWSRIAIELEAFSAEIIEEVERAVAQGAARHSCTHEISDEKQAGF